MFVKYVLDNCEKIVVQSGDGNSSTVIDSYIFTVEYIPTVYTHHFK